MASSFFDNASQSQGPLTTFFASTICKRCSSRPPAAASPSSSQSWRNCTKRTQIQIPTRNAHQTYVVAVWDRLRTLGFKNQNTGRLQLYCSVSSEGNNELPQTNPGFAKAVCIQSWRTVTKRSKPVTADYMHCKRQPAQGGRSLGLRADRPEIGASI